MESISVEAKDEKLNENVIDRLTIIFDFLKKNKKQEFKIKELHNNLKGNDYNSSYDTLRKIDIPQLRSIYSELEKPSKGVDKITFHELSLDRGKLIRSKNPDYKLVLEILNGLFSSSKNSSFSVISDLQDYCGIKPEGLINFDSSENQLEIVNNKDFFNKITESIESKKQIKITLKKNNKIKVCSPSLIKVFNKRWYLIGFSEDQDGKGEIIRVAFNNISQINLSPKEITFSKQKMKKSIRTYFENRIGVSDDYLNGNLSNENFAYKNDKALEINLRMKKDYYDKYFKDKPLFQIHKGPDNDDDLNKITVKGKLKINKELVTALFSYKNHIEVLEPIFLRNHMIEIIKDLQKMYND